MNLRKLLSTMLVFSLVFSLVSSAMASGYTPSSAFDAAERMAELGLVKGRAPGDYALSETITRAEMVTVLVRALGQESTAQLLAGAPAFADTNDHWASGYVALAKNLGITNGRTPTTFEPDATVTAAEAVAFLVKFLGLPVNDELGWPNSYLASALEAGIVTADDNLAGIADSPAPRGMVFFFSDVAFSNVKLENGKTVYQTYVKTDAPSLSVDPVAAVTAATSVTVTGKVSGHTALYVGGSAVSANEDGSFSASVALEGGENKIVVSAVDAVGNEAVKEVTVTREFGAAAAIEAADITVGAGAEVEVEVAVMDASGAVIPAAEVTGESAVGTYADGTFTAGTKAGTGTLTLRSGDAVATVNVTVTAGALAKVVADKASAAPGEVVTLTATDEHGNAITSGVTFSREGTNGVLDGNRFVGSRGGNVTITATQGDVTATIVVGVFGKATQLVVKAPETMTSNVTYDGATSDYGTGTLYDVTVSVADDNGNTVTSEQNVVVMLDGNGLAVFDKDKKEITTGVKVKDGVATFKVGVLVGQDGSLIEATASDTANPAVLDEGTAEIAAVERVATSVAFSGVPKHVASTASGAPEVKVVAKDQDGVTMADASYDVTVKVSGPAGIDTITTKETTVPFNQAGAFVFDLVAEYGSAGDITLTATIDGIGSATATTKAAVPGIAKALTVRILDGDKEVSEGKADDTTEYTVEITSVDAAGIPTDKDVADKVKISFGGVKLDELTITHTTGAITKDNQTIDFDKDSSNNSIGSTSFTISAKQFTGALPITVSASGMTSASGSLTFNPGVADSVGLTLYNNASHDTRLYVPVTEPTFKLSAQVYDEVNNKVAKAGVKVKFSAYALDGSTVENGGNLSTTADVTLNGSSKSVEVLTDENGVATVNVIARTVTDKPYTIQITTEDLAGGASADGVRAGRDIVTFEVAGVVVNRLAVTLKNSGNGNSTTTVLDPTVNSNRVEIWVKVTDNYGRAVEGVEDYLQLKLAEKILWDGSGAGEFVDNEEALDLVWYDAGDGDYFLADVAGNTPEPVRIAKAGTQAVVVEYTGAATPVASAARTVSVRSGPVSSVEIFDNNGTKITSANVKAKTIAGPYTIKLVDTYGNVVTTTSNTKVQVTVTPNAANRAVAVTNANGAALGDLSFRSTQTFYLSAPAAAGSGDPYTVTFQAYDSQNNAIGSPEDLEVTAE